MGWIPLHNQRSSSLQSGPHRSWALGPVGLGGGLLAAIRPLGAAQLVHRSDLEEVVRSCFQVPHGGLVPPSLARRVGMDQVLHRHGVEHHWESRPLNFEFGNGYSKIIRSPPLQRHRKTLRIRHDRGLANRWWRGHRPHGMAHCAPIGMPDLIHSADLKPVGGIRPQPLHLQSRFPKLMLLLDGRGSWHTAAIPHVFKRCHSD
mmetsp:Transcript_27030/g.61077  ORF Transcript_27030/g.61077 Transcript_27030/m.61077 type:complete len:203 (-) Transcript_27030:1760-2368(-)